jgi:hypothetical protein
MWQHLLSLPLVARVIALAGVGALALWALLKSKVTDAAWKEATGAMSAWFWRWAGKEIAAHHPKQPDSAYEKTYKGVFENYWYTGGSNSGHYFKITHDRVSTTVPVSGTGLFDDIERGDLVEIDTNPSGNEEIVKRVRVLESH